MSSTPSMGADEASRIIHAWLDGTEHDLRAYEALDALWLAAKLYENPTFDWTAPRPPARYLGRTP